MFGFDLVLDDVQPFEAIDIFTPVRVSVSFRDLDNWSIDLVEVPGTRFFDDWITIGRDHPLRRWSSFGIEKALDGAVDKIEAEIRERIEQAGGLRAMYRNAAE